MENRGNCEDGKEAARRKRHPWVYLYKRSEMWEAGIVTVGLLDVE